jgi:DNA-binding NarL/FixJ family response regulator
MNDVNIISKIKEKSPETKTLMLLNSENEDIIFKALKAGARGYLYRNASISELVKAIKTVHKGDLWIERKFFTLFFEAEKGLEDEHDRTSDTTLSRLTQREEEVLYCLTKSYTNKEIAKELSISEKTVKSHLNNIFRKLNVTGRLQAILYVINRGLKTDRD